MLSYIYAWFYYDVSENKVDISENNVYIPVIDISNVEIQKINISKDDINNTKLHLKKIEPNKQKKKYSQHHPVLRELLEKSLIIK